MSEEQWEKLVETIDTRFGSRFESVDKGLAGFSSSLTSLGESVSVKLDIFRLYFVDFDKRLTEFDKWLAGVDKQLNGLEVTDSQLAQAMAKLEKRLQSFEEQFHQQVAGLRQDIMVVREDVLRVNFQMGEVHEDLDMFAGFYRDHDRRIHRLEVAT